MLTRCTHYVGFRDDRYWNAYRVWGGPAFIHRWWDRRAQREIADCDVVVFADGDWRQPMRPFNAPDLDEDMAGVEVLHQACSVNDLAQMGIRK